MINTKEEELLRQLRSNIFSGQEITEAAIKRYTGQYKGIDVKKAIDTAVLQTKPAALPNVAFDKIVKLHSSRERIISLLDKHPEYLLNENGSEKPFEELCRAYEKSNFDTGKMSQHLKYIEDRARKQETKDTQDRLFETVRDFAQWCKEFLLDEKNKPLHAVLVKNFASVVDVINSKVSKVGINIIDYRDLAENCYSGLLSKSTAYANQGLPLILALINLKCEALGITIPAVNAVVACPKCGDKEQTGNICNKCSAYIKCPGCETAIKEGAVVCNGCGVDIAKIKDYVTLLNEAEANVSKDQIATAENQLAKVADKWGKNEKVITLREKIQSKKKQTQDQEKIIDDLIKKNNYCEAQKIIAKLDITAFASLQQKRDLINNKIASAKQLVEDAKNVSGDQKLEKYSLALLTVNDYQDALIALKANPPSAVEGLQTVISGKTVRLNWNKSSSNYINYRILRKENGRPTNSNDGEIIAEINDNKYDDITTVSGVSYYYAIYSKCADIFSKNAAITEPVMTIDEIDGNSISYDIQEKQISFKYKFPQNAKFIELHRDNVLLKDLTVDSYADGNLTPDKEYVYKFVAVYEDCIGKTYKSKGISISLKPTSPPKAIDLSLNSTSDKATLSWTQPSKGMLEIYYGMSPFSFNKNDIINMDSLKGEKVQVSGNSCVVNKNYSGERFYMPVTVLGKIGVAGEQVKIASIVEPENVEFERNDNAAIISWSWNRIESVRIRSQIDGGNVQIKDITKSGLPNPKTQISIPQNAKSAKIGIASFFKSSSGEIICSEFVEKEYSLQVAKVKFKEIDGGGFFSKNKYQISVEADSFVASDLCVLIGEGLPPSDLLNFKSHLTIAKKELEPGKTITRKLTYSRNNKNKPLIFRLIASDRSLAKNIIIIPETKQIK